MKKRKPLIGLTPAEDSPAENARVSASYLDALQKSGALPLILPLSLSDDDCSLLIETLDGFLFTGGPDIHPFKFGEETLEGCGNYSSVRDRSEFLLFSRVFQEGKPIFAICRGIQLINIALGGDIYQDLKYACRTIEIAHQQPFSADFPSHHVSAVPGSFLASIAGTSPIEVNSAHHQALRNSAPGLRACAFSPDGITEAAEAPGYPFLLGVQWHPELLFHTHEHARNLFRAFVDSCRKIPS